MARIRSIALALSMVLLFLLGVTGCGSQSTDANVSPAAASGGALTEWSSITQTIAGSIRPTFDAFEGTWTTAERYAQVWTSTFPATSFDPDHDSFAYGAQLAGLVDSDQLRVTGGFDGDNWIYLVEVSCSYICKDLG